MSRILAVASGKGGTGKTSIAVNLSFALSRMGRKVCLLDADLGLSNVDVLLGISPELTLEHVLFEGVPMERAVFPIAPGLDIVPGGSGVARLADLTREARVNLAREFSKLSGYDFLVVDGSPGISSQVISLCLACPELLVVVNPDPASITDAYALMKVLSGNGLRRSPHLVINKAKSRESAAEIFSRLRGAMVKYFKLDARYLGYVPQDAHVSAAAARQSPLVDFFPASKAGRAILELARNLDQSRMPAGAEQIDPAAFMESAVVRMREAAPMREDRADIVKTRQALDEAMRLANYLESPSAGGKAQVLARLKALIVKAQSSLMPPVAPHTKKHPQTAPLRVKVISSDAAIGDILRESLKSSGLAINVNGGRVDAAVVYWRGAHDGLHSRLSQLGETGYVYVRGVTSQDMPDFEREPYEIMDMPFKLDDLALAVRRCAMKFDTDQRGNGH